MYGTTADLDKAGVDRMPTRSAAIIAEKKVTVKQGLGGAFVCANTADVL
jgi:hypothetical protein